jgi:preprotein translocase YajC subunit
VAALIGAYYLMSRRQGRATQTQVEIQEGDEVVTSGGIVGIVDKVSQDRIWLEVAPEVVIEVMKNHVTTVAKASQAQELPEKNDEPKTQ